MFDKNRYKILHFIYLKARKIAEDYINNVIDETRSSETLVPTERTRRILRINNSSRDNIDHIKTWVETAFNEYKDQVNVTINLIRESCFPIIQNKDRAGVHFK